MRRVDLILWPRWIVPVVPATRVLERHGIIIDGGEIVSLVPADGAMPFAPAKEIHLPNHALIPGLVNAHTHVAMNLMRGVGDDLALMPWLEQRIWPIEGRLVDAEFVTDGTRHALAELMRGGVTTANDMYFFPDATLAVAREAGFRMVAGLPVLEFPTAWASGPAQYLEKARGLLREIEGDSLVSATVAPHAPYTVGDETFRAARHVAEEFGTRIHCHVHETQHEVDLALEEHGRRPLAWLADLGLLDEQFLAVHMTALTEAEIELVADSGTHVLHCPESNLKLASGFCPVARLLAAGVNVALGTDGAASNNDLDMFGEMKTAALLAKGVAADATALPAPEALAMATIAGARALGLDDRIGSIEPGKRADLAAVDLGVLEAQPVYDVISHLVYATGRHQVTDVWIDGRRVVEDREPITLERGPISVATRRWQGRITKQEQ